MRIQHNIPALNAHRNKTKTSDNISKNLEKLSSGYRINRAGDDAAGLAISEKMRMQIAGLEQGELNSHDGVSLCQTAEGALQEVNAMLIRVKELSVQAANGTYSDENRETIQREINDIISEVDRISESANFNGIPLFKGHDEPLLNPDGSEAILGDIPFDSFEIYDVDLGTNPFNATSNGDHLALQAIVKNEDLAAHGKTYNLIYGNGTTTDSSLRLTYNNGTSEVTEVVKMDSLTVENYSAQGTSWTREFNYSNQAGVNIVIKQSVVIDADTDTDKSYKITYDFSDNSTLANGGDVTIDFMFHADTAYNNNDRCEGYFIDGQRVDTFRVYSQDDSVFADGADSTHVYDSSADFPSSLSIIDMDQALAFSEKITFVSGDEPDSLSIGHYSRIDSWDYYNSLNRNLGSNADREDLGFSLMWRLDSTSKTNSVSFNYGIAAAESDQNLDGVDIKKDSAPVTNHEEELPIWIHTGWDGEDGLWLNIKEMNSEVIGIRRLDVMSIDAARNAMDAVEYAIENITSNRSGIGAYQNRLEHTINNVNVGIENLTSAESRIRDVDMAKEMMEFTKNNILSQASTSMLAQANMMPQGILQLLQ